MRSPVRSKARRSIATSAAALVVAAVLPSLGHAYWNYQGNLYPNGSGQTPYEYGLWHGGHGGDVQFRLNRSNCHPKWQFHNRSASTWTQWSIPGGCSNTDTGELYYDGLINDASRSINNDCCTGWANIRIVPV
jgi:hypothetical protein